MNRRVWVAITTEGVLGSAAGVVSFAVVPAPSRKTVAAIPLPHRPPAARIALLAPAPKVSTATGQGRPANTE